MFAEWDYVISGMFVPCGLNRNTKSRLDRHVLYGLTVSKTTSNHIIISPATRLFILRRSKQTRNRSAHVIKTISICVWCAADKSSIHHFLREQRTQMCGHLNWFLSFRELRVMIPLEIRKICSSITYMYTNAQKPEVSLDMYCRVESYEIL